MKDEYPRTDYTLDNAIDAVTLTFNENRILEDILKCKGKRKATKKTHGKCLICDQTGEQFKNKAAIARHLNCTESTVSHYFKGLQRTLKGYTFKETEIN